jgi:mycofactocin precursor
VHGLLSCIGTGAGWQIGILTAGLLSLEQVRKRRGIFSWEFGSVWLYEFLRLLLKENSSMEQDNMDFAKRNDIKQENEEEVFKTEEIIIEEMAIDGICGVY